MKRYHYLDSIVEVLAFAGQGVIMGESENGPWVLWDDARTEIERMQARIKSLEGRLGNAMSKLRHPETVMPTAGTRHHVRRSNDSRRLHAVLRVLRDAIDRSDTLEKLLDELLDRSTIYRSAIELDHDFDGEEWEKRVRIALEEK